MESSQPLKVLSLDGGGMRGVYTATYLQQLARNLSGDRSHSTDVGKAFDLIVGTSTGGIIACALSLGAPLNSVVNLYRRYGQSIFSRKLPESKGLWALFHWCQDSLKRPSALASGTDALRQGLMEVFGAVTVSEMYDARGIALAIPTIEVGSARPWVFKTPHLKASNHRDNDYSLVDVCLATSAAPVYRSVAEVDRPASTGANSVTHFVDGGLWANNPVVIGMVEALRMAGPTQPIEIYCLGNCAFPYGDSVIQGQVHRGVMDWMMGGRLASLAMAAQQTAYDHVAKLLAEHVNRECLVCRLPQGTVPANRLMYLGLDETRKEGLEALVELAFSDVDTANTWCQQSPEGRRFAATLADAPRLEIKENANV